MDGIFKEGKMKNMIRVETAEQITDRTLKAFEWFCKYILNPFALCGGAWMIIFMLIKVATR